MTAEQPEQQTAIQTCDNILEELHDILKEHGESEDYRLVEAIADLHERVTLWKKRQDIRSRPASHNNAALARELSAKPCIGKYELCPCEDECNMPLTCKSVSDMVQENRKGAAKQEWERVLNEL